MKEETSKSLEESEDSDADSEEARIANEGLVVKEGSLEASVKKEETPKAREENEDSDADTSSSSESDSEEAEGMQEHVKKNVGEEHRENEQESVKNDNEGNRAENENPAEESASVEKEEPE